MKAHPITVGSKILAPLVGGSDLSFRLLCRKYGAEVTFTEMIQAHYFNNVDVVKKGGSTQVEFHPSDRPLILQVAANVDEAEEVIKMVENPIFEHQIDGVDLNCGCPQGFAAKRGIGAFLFRKPDELVKMVAKIASRIKYPLSVKCRMHEDGVEPTVELLKRIIDAGASCITLHGRNWTQKGEKRGIADYAAMRAVKEALPPHISFVANGDIVEMKQFESVMRETGAIAGMSGYGALLDPGRVFGEKVTLEEMIQDYLSIAMRHRNKLIDLQRHLGWLTKRSVTDKELKAALFQAKTIPELVSVLSTRLGINVEIDFEAPHQIELPVQSADIQDEKKRRAYEKKLRQQERKAVVKKRAREEKKMNSEIPE